MSHVSGLFSAIDTRGAKTFCGPTAIAAITGLEIATVEAAVLAYRAEHATPRSERGMHGAAVKTMWGREVTAVCALLGYVARVSADYRGERKRPTLTQFARTLGVNDPSRMVLVTGHFVALHGHTFVDTCKRVPCHLREAKHTNRCRVVMAWSITKAP